MNKVIWLSLAMLAVVTTIGCSGADTPVSTPTPKPISESVDTTDDARVELGSWKATPPPIGFGGTITMYRDGPDGKIWISQKFPDGSTIVSELVQSAADPNRYDVVGSAFSEYYLVQGDVLGIYDQDGLIREEKH